MLVVAQGVVGGAGESGWMLGIGGRGKMWIEGNMRIREAVAKGGRERTYSFEIRL